MNDRCPVLYCSTFYSAKEEKWGEKTYPEKVAFWRPVVQSSWTRLVSGEIEANSRYIQIALWWDWFLCCVCHDATQFFLLMLTAVNHCESPPKIITNPFSSTHNTKNFSFSTHQKRFKRPPSKKSHKIPHRLVDNLASVAG